MTMLQLSIYLSENDMRGELPIYEAIVRRLLHLEVAGATVTHGVMGYGRHAQVHRKRLFGVSDDRPVVITAIDQDSKIRAAIKELRILAPDGLFTLHPVEIP